MESGAGMHERDQVRGVHRGKLLERPVDITPEPATPPTGHSRRARDP
jgi:hypothetical protein